MTTRLRGRSLRGLALNLTISVASLGLFVAVLEGGARLADPEIPVALLDSAGKCLTPSPLLGVEFLPNCKGKVHTWKMRTNELGLRGAPIRDGARRVLAVGDSCTYGWAVIERRAYPALLERQLNGPEEGDPYQVINAGVPGYTTYQGLMYLRERGLALEPDVVVVGFGFNDATGVGDIEVSIERQRRQVVASRADAYLMGRSTFYRWLRWRGAPAAQTLGPRVVPERYRTNFEQIIGAVRDSGAEVVMVDFLANLTRKRPEYRAAIAEVARAHGVPLVTYVGPTFDKIHPTAEGYRRLVGDLVPVVRGQLAVVASRP